MGDILRKAVEDRRNVLINNLIAFNVYKKEEKHLLELSLTELESEYRRFARLGHPHQDVGSIRWVSNRSKI